MISDGLAAAVHGRQRAPAPVFRPFDYGLGTMSASTRTRSPTMAKWHTISCEDCGGDLHICEDWDHPPKRCKGCKERNAAKWHEKSCEGCGTTIKICTDWDHPPKFCKTCRDGNAAKWYDKSCEGCGSTIRACTEWDHPPKFCKVCKASNAPKDVACSQCGKQFQISTRFQLKCRENGWDLPTRCHECKNDALLIKGAIGALRDEFPFALETTIEKRGILFTDKVAVVRNRRTGEIVAEVTMNEEGIFFPQRVAVAADKKTGEKISKTREGTAGIIFTKRTADTHNARSGSRTHRTKHVEKGIVFPTVVAETRKTDGSSGKTVTRTERRGGFLSWIFGGMFSSVTDKE